ncbi:MAG: pitrilysin family protein [Gemmatimonadaceae bacterium]
MAAAEVEAEGAAAASGSLVAVAGPVGVEAYQRTELPNGLTVISEFVPGVRSVALGAWVRSASIHESAARMGVSHLLEHMVFKGTERRTAHQIALALETLGGSLDAFTAREHTSFQARVLDEHLEQAADVIGDLLFAPALRDGDLQLERRVVLEEISMVEDTPDDLVFELHNEAMWGAHPYGYSILGTRETVAEMPVEVLRETHAAGYQPQHIVVACAGRLEHAQLLDVLGRTGWTERPRGSSVLASPSAPVALPPGIQHVEREGVQTHLVLGTPTFAYSHPDRYAVTLMNMLLGGGMSSRLFQRIREEMGLAYSVYAFQSFHADAGIAGTYVGTSPDTALKALDAVRRELGILAAGGFSASEVEMGKEQLKGQVMLSLEGASSRMYRLAAEELYGQPHRTLDDALAEIDRITHDVVVQLCATFLAPDRQTILSLGPGSSLT